MNKSSHKTPKVMNSRPSRSSSIPIPRSPSSSTSSRNIESLISVPFSSPVRYQHPSSPSPSTRAITEPRRVGVDAARPTTTGTSSNVSASPIHATARSVSLVSILPVRPSRTPFEPRVVRGSGSELASAADPDCVAPPATSPIHPRRTSIAHTRISGTQRPIVPLHVVARTTPVAFPRPTYLEYSSLRHLLQTEPPSLPIPSRMVETTASTSTRHQNTPSTMSPPSDNDDDGLATPPPQPRPTPMTTLISTDQPLKLPTRWSEQDRHQNLTVSPDGRDLTYHGWIFFLV